MSDIAGWIAPLATAIAAIMTASNLGARVTGWGFVVFVAGSVSWCIVALTTDQHNLLWANGFLTLVNLVGVWRWLGKQTRYERGGQKASARSQKSSQTDLVSLGALAGARVCGPDGNAFGRVAEVMLRGDDGTPAYMVVAMGGLAGVGETLHALRHGEFRLSRDGVSTSLTQTDLEQRGALETEAWPV